MLAGIDRCTGLREVKAIRRSNVNDLHFSVDGADAYRVLTTRQSTGVPLNIMSRWTGKSVTATLYEAKMLSNDIVEGPYQAAPRPFKVTP